MAITHIIGAGLAGLEAACVLVEHGRHVIIHEAARAAGGRCRSYFDQELNCRLDNGNHLLLSGNHAAMNFLKRVGAYDTLTGPADPIFPFIDLVNLERWVLRMNHGRLPWWIFVPSMRVPHTRLRDYLALLKLRRAQTDDLVESLVGAIGPLYRNLLEPLAIAGLNTPAREASAAPLRQVIAETIERGGAASIPCWPREGLSESFIDPALRWLAASRTEFRSNSRVAALPRDDLQIRGIDLTDSHIDLAAEDDIILATTAPVAASLVPGVEVPDAFQAILNVHYKHHLPKGAAGFWGLIGGTAEWVFAKGDILSVTISAANDRIDMPADLLAAQVWQDLVRAFGVPAAMPAYRVIKEKRATFAATPAQLARRPGAVTKWRNLFLAGDYTNTGLPATIEGAIRSGKAAALASLHAHAG
jgi:squalene-associated FAD-dependent desaturase